MNPLPPVPPAANGREVAMDYWKHGFDSGYSAAMEVAGPLTKAALERGDKLLAWKAMVQDAWRKITDSPFGLPTDESRRLLKKAMEED